MEGDYSGLIRPWEHYLPIKPNASDFESVYKTMSDLGEIKRMIERCRDAVVDCPNLRYSSKAREIIDLVREKFQGPEELPDVHRKSKILIERYEKDIHLKRQILWAWTEFRLYLGSVPVLGNTLRKGRDLFRLSGDRKRKL